MVRKKSSSRNQQQKVVTWFTIIAGLIAAGLSFTLEFGPNRALSLQTQPATVNRGDHPVTACNPETTHVN